MGIFECVLSSSFFSLWKAPILLAEAVVCEEVINSINRDKKTWICRGWRSTLEEKKVGWILRQTLSKTGNSQPCLLRKLLWVGLLRCVNCWLPALRWLRPALHADVCGFIALFENIQSVDFGETFFYEFTEHSHKKVVKIFSTTEQTIENFLGKLANCGRETGAGIVCAQFLGWARRAQIFTVGAERCGLNLLLVLVNCGFSSCWIQYPFRRRNLRKPYLLEMAAEFVQTKCNYPCGKSTIKP